MLISTTFNFVFFCTPKCASNSIEAALRPHTNIRILGTPELRHTNCREYHQFIQPFLRNKVGDRGIETVCLVREPLSWLDSWYRFRTRDELKDPNCPYHVNSTAHVTFAEFIEAYVSPEPPPFAQVGSQFDFVKDDADRLGIDRVFAYEKLGDFMEYMGHKVGASLTLKHLNVSPSKGFSAHQQNSLIAKFVGKIARRAGNKTRQPEASHPVTPSHKEDSLPPELMAALKKHTRDFALYDLVKNQRYRKGGALSE